MGRLGMCGGLTDQWLSKSERKTVILHPGWERATKAFLSFPNHPKLLPRLGGGSDQGISAPTPFCEPFVRLRIQGRRLGPRSGFAQLSRARATGDGPARRVQCQARSGCQRHRPMRKRSWCHRKRTGRTGLTGQGICIRGGSCTQKSDYIEHSWGLPVSMKRGLGRSMAGLLICEYDTRNVIFSVEEPFSVAWWPISAAKCIEQIL